MGPFRTHTCRNASKRKIRFVLDFFRRRVQRVMINVLSMPARALSRAYGIRGGSRLGEVVVRFSVPALSALATMASADFIAPLARGPFRPKARCKRPKNIARFEDAMTGSTRSFCSQCGPALLYERKRSLHIVNIPRARSSPAVPAASSATTWPSRSFRIGPTPANGLSPQGLSRYRLRTPEIAETPA